MILFWLEQLELHEGEWSNLPGLLTRRSLLARAVPLRHRYSPRPNRYCFDVGVGRLVGRASIKRSPLFLRLMEGSPTLKPGHTFLIAMYGRISRRCPRSPSIVALSKHTIRLFDMLGRRKENRKEKTIHSSCTRVFTPRGSPTTFLSCRVPLMGHT